MPELNTTKKMDDVPANNKSSSGLSTAFKGPFSFTKSSSFVLLLVIASVFLAVFVTLWNRIVTDSMPRIYEVQQQKTASIAARFLAFAKKGGDVELLKLSDFNQTPEVNYLSRWPLGEEIFVGGERSPFLIGRYDDETLWRRDLGHLNEFWKIEDGFAYLITIGGLNLGSSRPDLLSVRVGMKRETIDELFRGGLSAGVRAFKDGKKTKLVAHREIPNTNVVVFVEEHVDKIISEKWNDYLVISMQLFIAAIATFAVGYHFFAKLGRSFRILLQEADAIGGHRQKTGRKFEFSDEFFRLGRVMSYLNERLQKIQEYKNEEREVRRISYQFLGQASKADDFLDVCKTFASFLVTFHSEIAASTVHIYLLDQNQSSSSSPLYRRFCLVKSGAIPGVISKHVVSSSEVTDVHVSKEGQSQLIEYDERLLVCALCFDAKPWGYFVLENPQLERIQESTRTRMYFFVQMFANTAARFVG